MITKKTRKQTILEESAILFNDKGYSATSMQDIASHCGVRASSLYNHIKSKQEILSTLLLEIANKFYDGIVIVNATSKSHKEKLQEIIKLHIQVAMENQNVTSLVINDWKHLEDPKLTEFVALRNNYQNMLESIIESGMEKGEIKKANVKIVINIILSSLRWIYNPKIYNNTNNEDLVELENTIMDTLFRGVIIVE